MINLNNFCDLSGLIITTCTSILNVIILLKATKLVDLRLKNMTSIISSRVDHINDNTHTLVLNTITTTYLTLVLFLWWSNKLDIAPNHIDILILMYEIMVCITLTRSSWCARSNINRLLNIRKNDVKENSK